MKHIIADFVDYDLIPTRGRFKIIFETDAENQKAVFDILGYPQPGENCFVKIEKYDIPPFLKSVEQ